MLDYQINKKENYTKSKRLENRFLYFVSLKIPLTSSYSNRALVNYINIIFARDKSIGKKQNRIYLSSLTAIDKASIHNLVINNVLKFYI